MNQNPLFIDQIDSGRRFLGEFQKYMPVQVGFWLKETDSDEWSLYVASDRITDDNFDIAYGEVVRITGIPGEPWFDPFQVKMIGLTDPLAQAVLDIRRRYPGRSSWHLQGKTLGGFPVDEIYLYSTPIPVPA